MRIGALGDIHGDFGSARAAMRRHPDIPAWLCVGDVADEGGGYEPLPVTTYWIKGNNENFDAIASGALPGGLVFVPNGGVVDVASLRVAGLGGTFAPTWYDTPAADLPHPARRTPRATRLADRRRHFVREDVARCQALRGIDILLTHEAPVPFKIGRLEAGKAAINDVLEAMQPRLHLFGHHHTLREGARGGVRSIGLDLVSRSYLLLDARTLEYEIVRAGA